jgi:hypothetical protein
MEAVPVRRMLTRPGAWRPSQEGASTVRLSAAKLAPRALVFVALLCVLGAANLVPAMVAFGSVGEVDAQASATPEGAARVVGPPYPPELIVKTELRLKANLIARNLEGSPQLVFFGGSRSQRFDPDYALQRLGLRSVNIALSNARPEAAWAYSHWFYRRWPDAKLRWVWGVQPTMTRERDMDAALLQDPRFFHSFPDDLLESQRKLLPDTVAEMPRSYGFLRDTYSPLGMLVWNIYDARSAAGYTLDESLDDYIAKMLKEPTRESIEPGLRACAYFEKTLEYLNAHGTTPVLVLMPIHPRVLKVMAEHDLGASREHLREYLAGLSEKYDVAVIDFTRIQSFNGKPGWFYDGVHITRSNSNRVIDALRTQVGEYLE